MTDVPSAYTSQGYKGLRVNSGETALEFATLFAPHFENRFARVTGTVTSTSTSFADVTGMTFSVDANTDYIFEFDVIFQSSAAGTGIAFAVNGPASPTSIVGATWITPNSRTALTNGNFVVYDSGTPTSASTVNTDSYALVRGVFRNGANAGTFALRFASETGTAVTVRTGSTGRIYRTIA